MSNLGTAALANSGAIIRSTSGFEAPGAAMLCVVSAMQRHLQLDPGFRISAHAASPFRDKAFLEGTRRDWRLAGLPD